MEVNDIMTCIDRLPQGCSDKRYAGILKELLDECQSRIRKTFTLNPVSYTHLTLPTT